jgi:hypothetical protein
LEWNDELVYFGANWRNWEELPREFSRSGILERTAKQRQMGSTSG